MKALLLTSVPPCKETPAGLVLRDFVVALPANSVVSVAVMQPSYQDAALSSDIDIPNLRLIPPEERGIASRPHLAWATSRLSRLREKRRSKSMNDLLKAAADFGRLNRVDRLWAHLEATWTTRMAYPLAKALNLPMYTMVFDPPNHYMRANLMDPWTQAEVNRAFDRAIRSSKGCATGSLPMAEEYAARYGIPTRPLLHAFDPDLALPPLPALCDSDLFRIGVAGQLYAQDAWWHLLTMLDTLKWKIAGRRVQIRYLGRSFHMGSDCPRYIEFLGWHSQEDAVKLLGECDLLYCPYPFDPGMAEVARLSFPSKLVLYLAAARPIFFHGPPYASPTFFFQKTESALLCPILDKLSVYFEMKRLWDEPGLYGNLCANAAAALREHFSLENLRRNLYAFFDLEYLPRISAS